MSSDSSIIFLDPSFTQSLLQYGGGSVPLETLVWQRYVAVNGIDVSKPLTEEQTNDFASFFSTYQNLGLSKDALNSTALPPDSAAYSNDYAKAAEYFGYTGFFPAENPQNSLIMKDLWNGFLEKYSLDASLAQKQDLSALFGTYLHDLAYQQPTPTTTAITPPENVLQIALWNRFLTVYGYSPTDTSTDTQRKEFSQFLQQYSLWNIDTNVLQSTNELPSGDGSDFYLSLLNGFYGNLSAGEQKDLWNRFLLSQGIQSNPPDLTPYRSAFVTYLKELQAKKASFEATTSVSPEEQAQRAMFGSVMDSLSKMLVATEGVVQTNSQALMIYGAWQQQITNLMTRVPTLVAVPTSQQSSSVRTTIRLPSDSIYPVSTDPSTNEPVYWDLSSFTFGYDQLSFKEITEWAYQQLQQDPTQTISFGQGFLPISMTMSNIQQADGTPAVQIGLTVNGVSQTTSVVVQNPNGTYITASGTPAISQAAAFDDSISIIGKGYCQLLQNLYPQVATFKGVDTHTVDPTTGSEVFTYQQGLLGNPKFLDSTPTATTDISGTQTIDTSGLQAMQEQNVLLQMYVSTIRARRTSIQSTSQNIQATLQTARIAINKIASLWTSLLDAISTILQTLYK